jgi:hypothetical protein
MTTTLPASWYSNVSVYEREQTRIWSSEWVMFSPLNITLDEDQAWFQQRVAGVIELTGTLGCVGVNSNGP